MTRPGRHRRYRVPHAPLPPQKLPGGPVGFSKAMANKWLRLEKGASGPPRVLPAVSVLGGHWECPWGALGTGGVPGEGNWEAGGGNWESGVSLAGTGNGGECTGNQECPWGGTGGVSGGH